MTGLTTHVLDTANGTPAQGMAIDLYRIEGEGRQKLKSVTTNADGRVDGGPILIDAGFVTGTYELVFHAGDYLRRRGVPLSDPAFLDIIPIRFGISDVTAHYHVPLLISPYGYSTYRGS
jgi:5-hydroxyisourate hydrolase